MISNRKNNGMAYRIGMFLGNLFVVIVFSTLVIFISMLAVFFLITVFNWMFP